MSPRRLLAGLALSGLLFGGTAEIAVRLLEPYPRVQIIRGWGPPRFPSITFHEGTPLWGSEDPKMKVLRAPLCLEHDENLRVLLLVGDSVLYLTDHFQMQGNIGPALQERLGEGWCVVNAAHSGFSAAQKLASVEHLLQTTTPDVVFWEVWGEGPTYSAIGAHLYGLGTTAVDAEGYPVVPWVPAPLHHLLFRHSRVWEYAVLSTFAGGQTEDVLQYHQRVAQLAEAHDFSVLFALFPSLAEPFDVQERMRPAAQPVVASWAREAGLPVIDMLDHLQDVDVARVRMDTCCHFNQRGHAMLADKIAPLVTSLVAEQP